MVDVDELRAMMAKATPGPFRAVKGVEKSDDMRCAVCAFRADVGYIVATIENGAPGDFCDTEYANAMLIAEMWSSLPALLDELATLRAADKWLDIAPYDAGLLNDFGGGNIEWWQDYMRAELSRAHEFYVSQLPAPPKDI